MSERVDLDALSPVKRALHEVREMRAKLDRFEKARREPIAIVGLGCRFPGAPSPDAYWTLLREGREAITEIPADRWDLAEYFDPDPETAGRMYVRHGGFMSGIDRFDTRFFGIAPREAESMDPQQRLLLEVTWEALEHAGISAQSLMGTRGGVFVGICTNDYLELELRSLPAEAIDVYLASGGYQSVAAGRLSYVLGLQGPAMAIDTACSSSLVAVHLACQSLRARECDVALAGGSSLMLLPEVTINFCRARMLAPDGRCKTFDKSADGYVRGEGCGMLVLKRLSDAVAAGDRLLALIRGSAVNQDGRSSGLTVPNGPAQEQVIKDALASASLTPRDVQYVEAHGTGTPLGDPIEVQALARVLGEGRTAADPVLIGSAKTNVGHLEAAAGVAGLMKLVLSLQHREIPPHRNFREPNPHIDWRSMPVRVTTALTDWTTDTGRRIGGVSSFGFSGTNAHVIVEEAPAPVTATAGAGAGERPVHVLPLSARTPAALRDLATAVADRLESGSEPLADVCFTAALGRSQFEHRIAIAAGDREAACQALRRAAATCGDVKTATSAGEPPVGFLFTGMGSQHAGMGRTLYETEPTFRGWMDRCDAIVEKEVGRSILPVAFKNQDGLLDRTAFTQPALFALEYSLFKLWDAWGVRPAFVAGHSLGEDVAACVAGVFSLEDGLRIMCERGRLMEALQQDGAMAAVFASHDVVARVIRDRERQLAVAAINGPANTVLSGDRAALADALRELEGAGVKSRILATSHACHSPLMDGLMQPLERLMRTVPLSEPSIELVSTLTGRPVLAGELTNPAYWVRHVRETVRFGDAVGALWQRGCRTFVEIGPSATLTALGRRCQPSEEAAWLPTLGLNEGDWTQIGQTLASLFARGVAVDWKAWDAAWVRTRVTLPTYPFQRERYWSPAKPQRARPKPQPALPDDSSAWDAATLAASDHAERVPLDLNVASYGDKWQTLEQLTTEYMVRALNAFGAFANAGDSTTLESFLTRHQVLLEYRVLIGRWLGKLSSEGLLERCGDEYLASVPLRAADVDGAMERARAAFASDDALLRYVANCGEQLVEVLTGKESPLETLFPGGSPDLAAALYETSPVARYMNGIVRAAVAAASRTTGSCRAIEIGAGTGGTSSAVLPVLGPGGSYTFTDVGSRFLSKARERFAAYPSIDYALLDIERDPADQGFVPGSYDVVVAANVLHATRNLHKTADRALGLLRPGGLLVLLETTRHPSWFDISTGLIHGWQIFEDDLRTDNPLVEADRWVALLSEHGIEAVDRYPATGSPAEIFGQHVIVARRSRAAATESSQATVARAADAPAPVPAGVGTPTDLRERLEVVSSQEADELLVEFVGGQVSTILRLDPGTLDPGARLMDLGIDSLMAVELRNLLAAGLKLKRRPSATLIFDYPTVCAIAGYLRRDVLKIADRPVEPAPADSVVAAGAAVAAMDDLAIEALLNKTLETL